jgi:excisionase family DNA binding protein
MILEPKQTRERMQYLGHNSQMTVGVEPLIDATQAARILKLHPVTVREMASRGIIPAMKIGKVWRFRPSSLDDWVTRQLESSCYPLSHQQEER